MADPTSGMQDEFSASRFDRRKVGRLLGGIVDGTFIREETRLMKAQRELRKEQNRGEEERGGIKSLSSLKENIGEKLKSGIFRLKEGGKERDRQAREFREVRKAAFPDRDADKFDRIMEALAGPHRDILGRQRDWRTTDFRGKPRGSEDPISDALAASNRAKTAQMQRWGAPEVARWSQVAPPVRPAPKARPEPEFLQGATREERSGIAATLRYMKAVDAEARSADTSRSARPVSIHSDASASATRTPTVDATPERSAGSSDPRQSARSSVGPVTNVASRSTPTLVSNDPRTLAMPHSGVISGPEPLRAPPRLKDRQIVPNTASPRENAGSRSPVSAPEQAFPFSDKPHMIDRNLVPPRSSSLAKGIFAGKSNVPDLTVTAAQRAPVQKPDLNKPLPALPTRESASVEGPAKLSPARNFSRPRGADLGR